MSRSSAEAERVVVLRARLRVSVLVAVAITVLVAFVGGTAYAVMAHAQDAQVRRELRYGARHGSPSTPPGCTWLFTSDGGAVVDAGLLPAPPGFPLRDDVDAVLGSGGVVERAVERNGTEYLVLTQPGVDGGAVQAVFDTRYQIADRRHLLLALVVAELAGLLAAAVTGLLVGRRAVAPLAEALTRQRRFVTDASHELRTPIARAYTRAQLLARRAAAAELPGDHRDGLDKLVGSIRELGDVVDDLLLSALMSGQAEAPGGRAVDLAALAESVVAECAVAEFATEDDPVGGRRIALTAERHAGPLVVTGVETALRRAVAELLANAVRHTPAGGRIDVRLGRARRGQVELTVADTGDGFDPVEADRIFDRFHRGTGGAGGSAGPERRFGLGLALVREVVTSHGGTVEAVGHPGRGARFTLRLPAADPGAGAPGTGVTTGSGPGSRNR
ncbi:HAMP domain-containing sensor histidine kinase [Saccharothrix longispora]|uniref:Sensor-like histidine kinase SenX3 n=1 Tax=Saccharothrix longispora TaxID=33920 RepID=A0ABU1PTN7_9PSEU|nr:HAMP domain-containing sensor histidine kinase [Saccharothrix longispora]MDR6594015.1 signal transduction histidine kinase [Saccharothrix longispora]